MKTIDEMLELVAEKVAKPAPKAGGFAADKPAPRAGGFAADKPKAKTGGSAPDKPKAKTGSSAPKAAPAQYANKLSLSLAKELSEAVETAARIMGISVVCAVMDSGANLMLLHAMDDSFIASADIARDKAYTAVSLKMPTYKALEESRGGALDGLTNGNGIMLLGGGEPLIYDGKVMGAIGVSGGTKDQDITLAKTALEIFKIRIKEGLR